METKTENNKLVAHNYGHGGSGWTLAPGAAKHVVGLLKKQVRVDEKIAIIGAGALGLFSALELLNANFQQITIYADQFDFLTSHNAGGIFAPLSMDNDPIMQSLIDHVSVESYKFYAGLAKGENNQLKKAARIIPAYLDKRENSVLEPFVGKVMREPKDVLLDFGNGHRRRMVAYDDGIFIDTGLLMASLTEYVASRVSFIKTTIESIDAMKESVVLNCSGLAAKELVFDDHMVSVQGHLVMLKEQPKDMDYMILIFLQQGTTKSGFDITRSFYFLPKKELCSEGTDVGVLGSTFIVHAGPKNPHEEEFELLIEGAKDFYGLSQSR